MSIKGIFRSAFGTLLLLLTTLAILAVCLTFSQEQLSDRQMRRIADLRLIQEMRDAREYLTQFSRSYLSTGQDRYLELYESMLDIELGRKPRPVYLDETNWDVLAESNINKVRLIPAISFAELVLSRAFRPEEMIKLQEIAQLSLTMEKMEDQAFRDFAETKNWASVQSSQRDFKALEYINSGLYNQQRYSLRQNFAQLLALINDRSLLDIKEGEARNTYLLYAIVGIALLLGINVLIAYRLMLGRVILPIDLLKKRSTSLEKDLNHLIQVTEKLARGDLEARFHAESYPIDYPIADEIGHLVRVHNEMLAHMEKSGILIADVALDLRTSHEQAASADRAKSEFLANMTHEIRTPMNAIVGFSELLVSKVKDPVLRNYTEGIRVGSKNLLQLINDILDLSKIESGYLEIKKTPFQLAVLQREIMQMFSEEARQKGVNLSFSKLPDTSILVQLDESRLRQVLINLVGNALKFTNQGFVHVEVRLIPTHETDRSDFIIRVQDTGIGIDSKDFERIFQAFSQAEGQSNRTYGGTGLGLTISKRLVGLMDGQIDVESIKGQGSCFTLRFPSISVQRQSMYAGEVFEPRERVTFLPATVVIGEDVESNLQLLKAFLEPHPFTIHSAGDGQSVLNLVRLHNPDILLLDLQMPVIDGKELLRILRADPEHHDLSIVVLTAMTPYEEGSSWEALCNAIIRKPLRSRELFRELRKFLHYKMEPIEDIVEVNAKLWHVLGAESLERLRKLLRETEGQLHGGMDLDHIEEVSKEVYELAERETHEPLKVCAMGLLEAIEDFNTLKIKSLFDEIKHRTQSRDGY